MKREFAEGLGQLRAASRFADPALEAEYRVWRNAEALPLIRLAAVISLVAWLIQPLFNHLLGVTLRPLDWILSYGVIVPMLTLGALFTIRWFVERILAVATAMLCFAGFVIHTTYGLSLLNSIEFSILAVTIIAFFAPLMRLPPWHSVIGSVPYFLPLAVLVVISPDLSPALRFNYLAMPGLVVFFITMIALVNESTMRQTFANERELTRQRAAIHRYLPSAVAAQILAGREAAIAEPQRRRVTILFADLVGFTEIADRVEPEVMTQVISEHVAAMAALVEKHGGTVNEFMGDGLMALFGAPEPLPPEEHAQQALRAAQAMHDAMPGLNAGWRKLGLGRDLALRIGINTGMVSVGSYGSDGRMTYTAIGLQTNIAQRLESQAEPGSTLISEACWQLVSEAIDCEPGGELTVKGVHFPIPVFRPRTPATGSGERA